MCIDMVSTCYLGCNIARSGCSDQPNFTPEYRFVLARAPFIPQVFFSPAVFFHRHYVTLMSVQYEVLRLSMADCPELLGDGKGRYF